jgi:uncharacterized protein (DUF3084 family)
VSPLSFGFLVLIVLVSGGIAVLADWLGRKLGKKKLTYQTRWFRLRPKKTAQIATFISGFLVSLFTILFVYAVSSDVRQWIAEGPAAVSALNRTLRELEQARATKENVDNQLFNSREALRLSKQTVDRQKAEVTHLKTQSANLKADVARYQTQLDAARARYEGAQKRFLGIQARLNKSQSQLSQAQDRLKAANADVKTAKTDLLQAQANLKVEKDNLEKARNAASTAASQYNEMTERALLLDRQVAALEKETQDLVAQRTQVQSELDVRRQQVAQAQNELLQASLTLDQLKADLRNTQLVFQQAGGAVKNSRIQPITFALGEEIAREPLAAHATPEQALQAIRALVRQAQMIATEKGAEARGPFPVAGIFEREDPATRRVYTVEELEAQLAESVAGKEEGALLIAVSTFNAFKGEPVSLEIAVAENPVVYSENEVVAEVKVDGRKDDSVILGQITDFVSNQIKEKARIDRMIPKRGSDTTFGSIPMTELYSLVNRVRAAGRTVRLQAVAENDTRAGDPLRLDFRVK